MYRTQLNEFMHNDLSYLIKTSNKAEFDQPEKPPPGGLLVVAACATLIKVLPTRKSLPATPVVPPFPPARTSLTPADFGRAKIPPHHGNAVQLQLSRNFL